MFLGEMLGIREACEGERRRVLLIGSNAGDRVRQMAGILGGFLEEGLNTEVDYVRSAALIVDAIDGKRTSSGRKMQASLVIVGQQARQYFMGRGMTINVDRCGLIDHIREECGRQGIPLIRYRRNPDGSCEYYSDETENEISVLPSSK